MQVVYEHHQGPTLVQRACANVKGFSALHKRLEKKGKRIRTLSNYLVLSPKEIKVNPAIRSQDQFLSLGLAQNDIILIRCSANQYVQEAYILVFVAVLNGINLIHIHF